MPRNPAGIYTLPNPPVVAGTTILSSEENVTRDDIEDALTNSLDRNGRGPMLAPVRGPDGNQTAPMFSFTNETNSGFYRKAPNEFWFAVGGVDILKITPSGVDLAPGKVAGTFAVPTGMVLPFAGGGIPAGWLICDGALLATATYPALFAVLGYNWGGSGAFFAIPDMRNRSVIGASPGTLDASRLSARVLGQSGGEELHLLTIAEMPNHGHFGQTAGATADHQHSGATGTESNDHQHVQQGSTSTGEFAAGGGGGNMFTTLTSGVTATHTHNFTTGFQSNDHAHAVQFEGGSTPFNNQSPFATMYWLIKT